MGKFGFTKYLARTFLVYLASGAGLGLGSAATAMLVIRADEAIQNAKKKELTAEYIEKYVDVKEAK